MYILCNVYAIALRTHENKSINSVKKLKMRLSQKHVQCQIEDLAKVICQNNSGQSGLPCQFNKALLSPEKCEYFR